MDWSSAIAIVGTIGLPLTALVVKAVPKRVSPNGHVSVREFARLQAQVEMGFQAINESLKEIKKDLKGK